MIWVFRPMAPRVAASVALIFLISSGFASADTSGAGEGSIIGPEDPHYERGVHLLRLGEVDAAVPELARANELGPDDPRILGRYAQALLVSGDVKESIRVLERLRELDPNAPDLNYFLGLASYQGGDWSRARQHLQVAVADNPDNALAFLFLGVAEHELGEYDEASQALDEAERLDPSLAGQVAYRRGLIHFEKRQFDEARVEFETVELRRSGSPLARSAASYVARMERLNPRPWDVYATFGGGYDSNLNFSSDSDPTLTSGIASGRIIAEGGGSYLFGGDRGSLTLGQTLYGHFYPDGAPQGGFAVAPQDFDQQISRTWAQAQADLLGPISIDARYTFEFVWIQWAQFRRTNAVEPGLSFRINDKLVSRAFFRWEGREFFILDPTPGFDRDGDVTHTGADLSYALPSNWFAGQSYARVGYRMRREDTQGDQYDAYGQEPVITLSLVLPQDIVLTLDGRVEWRDYEFASSVDPAVGPRKDVIGQLGIIAQRPLGNHFSVELDYHYTNRSSNVPAYEYVRHVLSVLATYRY